MPEVRPYGVWKQADGSMILRVSSETLSQAANALREGRFDGVEYSGSSFESLAEVGAAIRWLHAPDVESPDGLEALDHVERITYVGAIHDARFDYRRLPRLKDFRCHLASAIDPAHLNHPAVERLEVEGIDAHDLSFLSNAKNLRSLRIAKSALRSLAGIAELENLVELKLLLTHGLQDISDVKYATQIESLEIVGTPKIDEVSAIYRLKNLRWLYIDGRKARQGDLSWLLELPRLECALIEVETAEIDWDIFASHPRLYSVAFYSNKGFTGDSDDVIRAKLGARGRQVKQVQRFPRDRFPAFHVEFAADPDIECPLPYHAYQTNLMYDPAASTIIRPGS
jgi:hypothetical protein